MIKHLFKYIPVTDLPGIAFHVHRLTAAAYGHTARLAALEYP